MLVEEKIVKALAVVGTHSPEDVYEAISRGRMQLWGDGDSVLVTTINSYPRFKACESFMAAGDLDVIWRLHDEQVIPWAKDLGCQRMIGRGRKGWLKSAREHGYGREWVMTSKEI